jgi:hypothetical protein
VQSLDARIGIVRASNYNIYLWFDLHTRAVAMRSAASGLIATMAALPWPGLPWGPDSHFGGDVRCGDATCAG